MPYIVVEIDEILSIKGGKSENYEHLDVKKYENGPGVSCFT